jgi:ribonuclease BN (tRNA processing enzyme)
MNAMKNLPIEVFELLPANVAPPSIDSLPYTPAGVPKYVSPSLDGSYSLYDDSDHKVQAAPLKHSTACYGYVVSEKPHLRLDADKITSLGVPPGKPYRLLKAGIPIQAPNGSTINPSEVVSVVSNGRKIAIMGDNGGAPTPAMRTIAHKSDLLVHEATFPPGDETRAIARLHSTSVMTGNFAKTIQAKNLVLTHFSAASLNTFTSASIDSLGLHAIAKAENELLATLNEKRQSFAPKDNQFRTLLRKFSSFTHSSITKSPRMPSSESSILQTSKYVPEVQVWALASGILEVYHKTFYQDGKLTVMAKDKSFSMEEGPEEVENLVIHPTVTVQDNIAKSKDLTASKYARVDLSAHAFPLSGTQTIFPSAGSIVQLSKYAFPTVLLDKESMVVTAAAQETFEKPSVIPARDFMAIVVDLPLS